MIEIKAGIINSAGTTAPEIKSTFSDIWQYYFEPLWSSVLRSRK